MNQNATSPENKRSARHRLRLWEKKRGARTSVSSWWGKGGEVLFFAVLFFGGVFTLTEIVTLQFVSEQPSFLTTNWGFWLTSMVTGALIVTGAVGAMYAVMYSSTTTERRAALTQRATSRDLLADLQSREDEFPAIPNDAHWKISPGVHLAYRLPSGAAPGLRLVVSAVFTLVWNAAVIVLAVLEFNLGGQESGRVIREFLSRPWFNLTGVILILFAAIGIYLIYQLVRQLMAAEAMGPTHVELCSQPLHPGGRYRLSIAQHGHLQIKLLEAWLVCDEEVSFSEGTDTRTESRRVHEDLIHREENISILPSAPFHCETALDIPDTAMHSLATQHNSISWKLTVKAESKKWPKIHREFPLVMHPQRVSAATSSS